MILLSAQAMTPKKIAEVTSHQRRPGLPVLEIQADVEAGGALDLLPEPTVAVRGCPAPDSRACRGGGRHRTGPGRVGGAAAGRPRGTRHRPGGRRRRRLGP
ncbi:hypothetical protein [Frankia sp. EAN1pec]|uniref:hypothetical protein n=1 Tax=Parafrankia sp. (strain EAN1pec) TaxID=298653 RepID=UPI000054258C